MTLLARARRWCADRAWRSLTAVYYEAVFDRGAPLGAAIGAHVHAWEQRRGKHDVPAASAAWDGEYAAGRWSYLQDLAELGRYSILSGYLHELAPDGAVLDVGCGEGLLFRRLLPPQQRRYVGVDLSSAAIDRTRAAAGEGTFIVADAETYVPDRCFDAMVFNEVLYYFRKPFDVVDRFRPALTSDGIIIVSTYLGSRRARAILRGLRRRYTRVDETRVEHDGHVWSCAVLRCSGPSSKVTS